MPEFVACDQRERFAGQTVNLDFDGPLELWRTTFKRLAQAAIQFRVVGFPQFVADMDAREINVAVAESQFAFRVLIF